MSETFAGDKKVDQSILHKPERKIIDFLVPLVPNWISTKALTYYTIPISLLIVVFSFAAQFDIRWLWGVSIMIFLQWLTDSLDGSVGRYRNSGLIKWGYYMDHFLDYIFLCSILIGYSLILPDSFKYLQFFILAIFGAFMVNSFLAFAATNKFKITFWGIGPTEIRIIFILINTFLILFGKTYMAFALPYVLGFSLLGLVVNVYKTQKYIYKLDMINKQAK